MVEVILNIKRVDVDCAGVVGISGRDMANGSLFPVAIRVCLLSFPTLYASVASSLLLATCDVVRCVTGCFSGTLGFICTALQEGQPFSEAVREARDRGYTEPDPRDDLSGRDVARKALIIARQLGAKLEMDDIGLEALLTPELAAIEDPECFLARLPEMDAMMAQRVREAEADGKVPRFLARITPSGVTVGLESVPRQSAAGQLSGPDNILVFETERYCDQPLIIQGPGAGAEVTAAGVLGDILKIVRAT